MAKAEDGTTSATTPISESRLQEVVAVFKTLSDPTRMRIILTVANGSIAVNDIANRLGLSQSTVSHQLRILRQARLVEPQRDGKSIRYHLVDNHVIEIYQLTNAHIAEKQQG